MLKSTAFVPAHISGFFQPCEASDPERAGSRNCGPCLDLGVLTEVRVERASRMNVSVSIDGERSPHAKTTMSVVKQLLRIARGPFRVEVNHSCQVPVGAGYGASGAGALGTAFALSGALGLGLSREKLVAMAHVAEVTCRTGLGDVGAQATGGLVMGIRPGAPPHGRWRRIAVSKGVKVICATLGPLPTKDLLCDEGFKRRASGLGEQAIRKLARRPTLKRFMLVSREFTDGLGLLDRELRELIAAAGAAGAIGASQVMLGRAVFAQVEPAKLKAVRNAFLELLEPGEVLVTGIDGLGARLA